MIDNFKPRVVVSRHWHRPDITVTVVFDVADKSKNGVKIEVALDDFLHALAMEITPPAVPAGSLWKRLTSKQSPSGAQSPLFIPTRESVVKAGNAALEKIKEASVPVRGRDQ